MDGRQVTVGVDGSVAAFRALDTAAAEAGLRGARLDVVHCVPDRDEAGPVLRSAAARVRERHPRVPVTMSAVEGDPVDVLADRSRTSQMVVVGCRGGAKVPGLPLHSVSRRLAARAQAPLLVVRGPAARTGAVHRPGLLASATVLLGAESDEDTHAALFAFQEAGLRRAPLRVVHPWTYRRQPLHAITDAGAVGPVGALREETGRQARAAALAPQPSVATPCAATPGHHREAAASVRPLAYDALVEATGTAGLIVISAHRRHAWSGRQLGPVIDVLLRHSRCPVAVVPVPDR